MSFDVKEFGRRLKNEREARSMSVDAIARQAAVSEAYVHQLERGELQEAPFDSLDALARALAIPLLHLLTDSRGPTTQQELAQHREREAAAFWAALPTSLRAFVEQERAAGREVADDALKSLAGIKFQHASPNGPDAWRPILDALMRGLHPT